MSRDLRKKFAGPIARPVTTVKGGKICSTNKPCIFMHGFDIRRWYLIFNHRICIINTLWIDVHLSHRVPTIPNVSDYLINMNRITIMGIQSNMVDKRVIREQPISFLMCMTMKADHVLAKVFIIKVSSKNGIMADK